MSEKTKITEKLSDTTKQLGYVVLAGLATMSMVNMPDRLNRIILPSQPAFAFAGNNLEAEGQNNSIRREREEVAPHYISYAEVQRTASRSGKF